MYVKLKPLIIWPEREILHKTMPMDFRKHCPNCIVIDCFEIFLERPTNLLARAQTYFILQAPQHSQIFDWYNPSRISELYFTRLG